MGWSSLNSGLPTSGEYTVSPISESNVELAVQDLNRRTLAAFETHMGRLVYLSSTRDYNSGAYYHDGLAMRFDPAVAQAALAQCHRRVLASIIEMPLSALVDDLDRYLESTAEQRKRTLDSWQRLRAYQMLVPSDFDVLSTDLFLSNMKLALAVLRLRVKRPDEPEVEW
jgi:hypothetical protein